MIYRRFGKTEMMLSQMTLGCMQFAGDKPKENGIETVVRAVEMGVNHLETARGYTNSEERVGQALKVLLKTVPRDELYITTKIGPDSDVEKFKKNFEISQELLGIDCIDNLDFHGPGSWERVEPAMRPGGCLDYVRKLQAEGRIKHFGFSSHGYPKGVMEVVNTEEFDSVNMHYYYFNQGLRDVVARAHELDMGVFIISPNGQGGRLHRPTPELTDACAPLTPAGFTHMWLLNDPRVHTLSFGPASPEEVEANLVAADYDPDGPERATFNEVLGNVEAAYRGTLDDTYCTICNECLPCPENINIPGLLNWRNMAVGFDMMDYAQGRYSRVGGGGGAWVPGVKGDQCTKCGDCLPRCPEKLDIPELLWDAHQRLETGEVTAPRWQHEGDLQEGELKQT